VKDRRKIDTIIGHVSNDSSIYYASDDFTVIKQGTGIYDVIFPRNFRFITANVQSHSTSYADTAILRQGGINGFRVGVNNTSTAAAADSSFSFAAYGEYV
jgi:hypothetical protein